MSTPKPSVPKRLCCHATPLPPGCRGGNHPLRALDEREDKLDELLLYYTEAQETLYSGQGRDEGADAGLLRMPLVWNMSYRELERTLDRMAVLAGYPRRNVTAAPPGTVSPRFKSSYVNLWNWYMRAKRVRVPVLSKQGGRMRQVVTQHGPQFEAQIVRKADPEAVLRGLEWVSAEFVGEPFLPTEFVDARAA